jgi:hypothetical protein
VVQTKIKLIKDPIEEFLEEPLEMPEDEYIDYTKDE